MAKKPTTAIRIGLWALPLYGALTAWATLDPQPNQATDPGGWARFVSTNSYLVSHLVGSTGGTILAILGTMALGGSGRRSLRRAGGSRDGHCGCRTRCASGAGDRKSVV